MLSYTDLNLDIDEALLIAEACYESSLEEEKRKQQQKDEADARQLEEEKRKQQQKDEADARQLQQEQKDRESVRSKPSQTSLLKHLQACDLTYRNNPGEGDCMYYSIADALDILYGICIPMMTVRIMIADWLEQHGARYAVENFITTEGGTLQAFCNAVRTQGVWGDHVAVKAAASMWGTIRIWMSNPVSEHVWWQDIQPFGVEGSPSESTGVCEFEGIQLLHQYEQHYMVVFPTSLEEPTSSGSSLEESQ